MSTSSFDLRSDWAAGASVLCAALALLVVEAPADARKGKTDPDYAPSYAPAYGSAPANGAIFQAEQGYAPLTSGARAGRVGDILTIVLAERTQASKSNAAKTDRSGSISLDPPTTGPISHILKETDLSGGAGSKFDGNGQATQSNQLNGEITVTIAEIYPNGTMLVRGEKLLTLNRGDERVQISGIIRAIDISPENRVLSTRVADANIRYVGKGEIARASKQGWLQSFFSMISPF